MCIYVGICTCIKREGNKELVYSKNEGTRIYIISIMSYIMSEIRLYSIFIKKIQRGCFFIVFVSSNRHSDFKQI